LPDFRVPVINIFNKLDRFGAAGGVGRACTPALPFGQVFVVN
jgi:hypothetical protein